MKQWWTRVLLCCCRRRWQNFHRIHFWWKFFLCSFLFHLKNAINFARFKSFFEQIQNQPHDPSQAYLSKLRQFYPHRFNWTKCVNNQKGKTNQTSIYKSHGSLGTNWIRRFSLVRPKRQLLHIQFKNIFPAADALSAVKWGFLMHLLLYVVIAVWLSLVRFKKRSDLAFVGWLDCDFYAFFFVVSRSASFSMFATFVYVFKTWTNKLFWKTIFCQIKAMTICRMFHSIFRMNKRDTKKLSGDWRNDRKFR